jgi:hypothetical protein
MRKRRKENDMLNMRTTRNVELFGAALILLALVATAVYFGRTPAPQPSIPAANVVSDNNAMVSVSANPAVPRSLYVSEQTLRRRLDDAYENHDAALVQTLLHTLNGRDEHRCCGLPR